MYQQKDMEFIDGKMIYNGYIYLHQSKICEGEKWVCVKRRQGCRGATVVQETAREVNQHNHPPVPCDIEVLRCRNELKRRALTSNDPPARILADVLNHISYEAKVKMGNISNLKRYIQRSRSSRLQPVPSSVKQSLQGQLTKGMEFIDGKMIYNGYIYNRQGKMCERNRWICVRRWQGCRGTAMVYETAREIIQHNHPPEPCDIEVLRCRSELKRRASTSSEPPAPILADVLNHISDEAKVKMGNISSLKRFIQRSRSSRLQPVPSSVKQSLQGQLTKDVRNKRELLRPLNTADGLNGTCVTTDVCQRKDTEFTDGKMIYNGYIYNRQRKVTEPNRWVCVKRWRGCKGAAVVEETAREVIQHNHPPEPCDIEVLRCRSELKRRASTSNEPTALILADVLNHISDEAKVKMGNESSLKRFIQRSRRPYLLAPVKRTIVKEERRIPANYIRRSIAVQVDLTEEAEKVDQMTQTRPRYDPVTTKVVYKFVTDEEAEMDEIDECFPLLKQ